MISSISSRIGAALSVGTLLIGLATVPAGAAPRLDPSRYPGTEQAQQVVVVTAPRLNTTHGTVRAFERDGDAWRTILDTTPARLGSGGLVAGAQRRQGTGKTPLGTYGIEWAFGRAADPGTALRYVQIDRNDAWTYNPKVPSTYNVFQTAPNAWRGYGRYIERLWGYGTQYDYVLVLDYNLPAGPIVRDADGIRRSTTPPDTRRGGGIFLHVTNGKVTAGCIAIPRDDMAELLRWLDPAKDPVIVIALD